MADAETQNTLDSLVCIVGVLQLALFVALIVSFSSLTRTAQLEVRLQRDRRSNRKRQRHGSSWRVSIGSRRNEVRWLKSYLDRSLSLANVRLNGEREEQARMNELSRLAILFYSFLLKG